MPDIAHDRPAREPRANAPPARPPLPLYVPPEEAPREAAIIADEVLAAFAYNTPLIV